MSTQPTDAEIARDVRDLAEALSCSDSRVVLHQEIHRVVCSKFRSVDALTSAATSVAAVRSFRVLLAAILDGSYHEAGLDSEEEVTADDATPADAETTDAAEEDITPEDALAGLLVSALLKVLAPDDDSEASTPDDE